MRKMMLLFLLAFMIGCGSGSVPFVVYPPVIAPVQQNGNGGGRTTGAHTSTFSFNAGVPNASCSGTTCTGTGGPVNGPSQVVSGTLTFHSSTDATGSVGGPSGGGAGQFQFSCDGGGTWNALAAGSATLPTTTMAFTYNTIPCNGPANLNTVQFRNDLNGGGGIGFNMAMTQPSSVTVTW